jgi:hypothetical protein
MKISEQLRLAIRRPNTSASGSEEEKMRANVVPIHKAKNFVGKTALRMTHRGMESRRFHMSVKLSPRWRCICSLVGGEQRHASDPHGLEERNRLENGRSVGGTCRRS